MPYSGTLMTRVFTSRSQLPVEDAAVSILQHEPGGRQRLINIQTSDRSGNTVPTIIETPDAQNSQSPGQETPFSLCDIWVECPGYQLLLIQNVQIFPGIASIQDLPLIPLAETGGPAGQQSGYLSTGPIKEGAVLCQLSSHRIFQPISPFI